MRASSASSPETRAWVPSVCFFFFNFRRSRSFHLYDLDALSKHNPTVRCCFLSDGDLASLRVSSVDPCAPTGQCAFGHSGSCDFKVLTLKHRHVWKVYVRITARNAQFMIISASSQYCRRSGCSILLESLKHLIVHTFIFM